MEHRSTIPARCREEGNTVMFSRKFSILALCSLCVAVLCLGLTPPAASATPDPTEQLRPFVKKVTDTLTDPGLKTLPKKEQAARLVVLVRERFDFREMSKRVLGQQWRKLDAPEQDRFENLLTDLLQYAYVGRVEEYSGQTVEFVQQRIRGQRAEVQTLLVDKWMAYDIVVEGVSLVRNYMEQFSEILRKDGYAGLLRQMEEKVRQFEQEIKPT
jgi:phospholipid transport system substrate-binding protein